MGSDDAYAPIAEFYDLEHDDFADDIAFYAQYVETAGDPVLELACGTGRIAVPIAAAGHRVVGADISEPMLARGRDRARRQNVDVAFTRASLLDARGIAGGPFGVVIMALGALNHLVSLDDQVEALTSARQALDPRGVLLLDVMHASPSRLHALDGAYGHDGSWTDAHDATIDRFSAFTVHPATQTIESRVWYDRTAPDVLVTRRSMRLTQRYVTPGELVLMLDLAGFEETALYGGYELEPFEDASERLIVAAEATKTR